MVRADYLPEIERVGSLLRPYSGDHLIERFTGRVETLNGELEEERRRAGDVTLSLLHPDGELVTARANLTHEQYAVAMRAHEAFDLFVYLRGRLSRAPRVSTLDRIEFFKLIDHDGNVHERDDVDD